MSKMSEKYMGLSHGLHFPRCLGRVWLGADRSALVEVITGEPKAQ